MPKYSTITDWADYLKYNNRFTLTDSQWSYLSHALEFVFAHPTYIDSDTCFFRARKHHIGQTKAFSKSDMGAPPIQHQRGSRCAPQGIYCLYLSSDADTAVAETRPWKGAHISVARFRITKRIMIADLRYTDERLEQLKMPPDDKDGVLQRVAYMLVIGDTFSRPGHENSDIEYVPTQFISGILKQKGFSGISYASHLSSSGTNLALFDSSAAKSEGVSIHEVVDVHCWSKILRAEQEAGVVRESRSGTRAPQP